MTANTALLSESSINAPVACVILGAGMGTRMKSNMPKVLHHVAGEPMIRHVLYAAQQIGAVKNVVVVGPDMVAVSDAVAPAPTVIQHDRLGTADAVKPAREYLADFTGTVLILYGDSPLVTPETLTKMVVMQQNKAADGNNPAVIVLGARLDDPAAYGRLITDDTGALIKITEFKDANADERAVNLCNGGIMAVDGKLLFPLLDQINNDNAQGEYYLTDMVEMAIHAGHSCAVVEGSEEDFLGVNSRLDLAAVEAIMQNRLRRKAMVNGATLTDPESVFLCSDTKIGRDVIIGPNVVFGPKVEIADDVEIRAFCHLEDCVVKSGSVIGPYARLRPGSVIEKGGKIGNFVEVKKAHIGEGAKVNHLSYVGDAQIGARANIGAGTITCNYDGYFKYKTVIGEGAFIGSNSALVAPAQIGAQAIIGAGSVITQPVPDGALSVARGRQENRNGWAHDFHEKQSVEKAAKKKAG